MAQLSLGEGKWRMVRRVYRKPRFRFEDARNWTRLDTAHFEWLVGNGFFGDLGGGWYKVTDRAKAAADLGLYELEVAAGTE
jgi:hypothetical protein